MNEKEYFQQNYGQDNMADAHIQDMNNQLENFVFVYAKDKKIRVLGIEESRVEHNNLITDEWQHTATVDACKWIEHLHNECQINDLHRDINQLTTKI